MKWATVLGAMFVVVLGLSDTGWAQSEQQRPATMTSWGDTGFWFVPTGEVLPSGQFSASVQRTEEDFRQGNTNVSFWPVAAAYGAGRVELFGALRVVTRIDRDTQPLLFAGPNDETGGLVNDFPTVNNSWTGNQLGDLFAGGKFNLLSQREKRPMALAVRGTVKFPTADRDKGAGTGEYDGFVDMIGSSEYRGVEVSGFGGVAMRGDPDDVSLSDGFRMGAGAAFPTRRSLRVTGEIFGEWAFDQAVVAPAGLIVAEDGSTSPANSRLKDSLTTALGVTWQHSSGLLLGVAGTYSFGIKSDPELGTPRNTGTDAIGLQVRVGFHPGVKSYLPPPPAVALAPPPVAPDAAPEPAPRAAAAAAAPAANRPPVVRASCNPCTLEEGGLAHLRAEASDPDGDPLTVLWTTSGGTLSDTRAMNTDWRAETSPGLVTFGVVVEDSHGARSTDTVTIQVSAGEEGIAFKDVLFEFDSARIRPEAVAMLDPVVATLTSHPDIELLIEGHTCDIGTAEYNLALGERRANAVRDYLVSRGISAARLTTTSFGELKPANPNTSADNRRRNRRAVLVVHELENDTNTN
jgi:outer membrane protein OmpA-like peptidoglycan-associated protein